MYDEIIAGILSRKGLQGKYNPRHIEGYIRLQYSTLDHLSLQDFESETKIAIECIDMAGVEHSEWLAKSYGL